MFENAIFTLLGAVVGWLISHLYARSSSRELTGHFSGQREALAAEAKTLSLQNEQLQAAQRKQGQLIEQIVRHFQKTDPEAASAVISALKESNQSGIEQGIFNENSPCPQCEAGRVSFTNWGGGPLGVSNAWFQCSNCGYRFQTSESSND